METEKFHPRQTRLNRFIMHLYNRIMTKSFNASIIKLTILQFDSVLKVIWFNLVHFANEDTEAHCS